MSRDEAVKELLHMLDNDTYGHDLAEFREFLEDVSDDTNKQEACLRFIDAATNCKEQDIFSRLTIYDLYAFYEEAQDENA